MNNTWPALLELDFVGEADRDTETQITPLRWIMTEVSSVEGPLPQLGLEERAGSFLAGRTGWLTGKWGRGRSRAFTWQVKPFMGFKSTGQGSWDEGLWGCGFPMDGWQQILMLLGMLGPHGQSRNEACFYSGKIPVTYPWNTGYVPRCFLRWLTPGNESKNKRKITLEGQCVIRGSGQG